MRLSVVISAYNEDKKIKECLESISWADEIIFVDNSSTDATVSVAKNYTDKIFRRANNLMLNKNKNYGIGKAAGDWILVLDADESVTEELREEIIKTTGGNSQYSGYYIPRKNIIFGKWIEHAGWYPDYQLRLFKKGTGKFPEEHVHEMIALKGNAGHLKNALIHQNYETISQFLRKMSVIYAPNEAENLFKKGYSLGWSDAIRFPMKEFSSRFFSRQGYKDGLHGLVVSMLMGFYHFIVFSLLWEKNGFKQYESDTVIKEFENEIRAQYRDLAYWILQAKLDRSANYASKLWMKICFKLGFI